MSYVSDWSKDVNPVKRMLTVWKMENQCSSATMPCRRRAKDGCVQRTGPSDVSMPILARVREIGFVLNWWFTMLVGEEGCLRDKVANGKTHTREKATFPCQPMVDNKLLNTIQWKNICPVWRTLTSKFLGFMEGTWVYRGYAGRTCGHLVAILPAVYGLI